MDRFTWVDFFKELSIKLLPYRGRGKELIEKVNDVYEQAKLSNSKLKNNITDAQLEQYGIDYNQVDPFTIFGVFNRGLQIDNRKILCSAFKDVFDIDAEIPSDFDGIPVMDMRQAWIISENYDLWDLYEAAINYADYNTDRDIFIESFNKISTRKTSIGYVTFGLFWIRPETYIGLDTRNYHYIKEFAPELMKYFKASKETGEEYLTLCEGLKEKYKSSDAIKNGLDLSYNAWLYSMPLMFQCNPDRYDIKSALNNLDRITYRVNKGFVNKIVEGMRVYLWISKSDGGVIAKAKTISKVGRHDDPEGDQYFFDEESNSDKDTVWIEFTDKLQDSIISRDVCKKHPTLKDMKIFKMTQGTTYELTIEQAKAIDDIIEGKPVPQLEEEPAININETNDKRYWIYSPGENAFLWEECIKNGIMYLGWGELGDLTQYASREEMREKMLEIYEPNSSYSHSALATWEFVNVMKQGDVIFAKKGNKKIIGRGIVTGDYEFVFDREGTYKNIRKVNWINNEEHEHIWSTTVMKTLTDITKYPDYWPKLNALFDGKGDDISSVEYQPYDKTKFLEQVFMDEQEYDKLSSLLKNRKNIILTGSPGVGKTFMAKKLAYSIMKEQNEDRILPIQFHQSYSYEDFIEGFRPTSDGKLEIIPGAFKDFCDRIQEENNPDKKYFCIIDEINRGNLSKIFGELMMLIEEDKRESSGEYVILPYSRDRFSIPDNLFIIGTMNTADRSLSIVDYALRRRFVFYPVKPAFGKQTFKKYLMEKNSLSEEQVEFINKKIISLNKNIEEYLGEGFNIGHSYFINKLDPDNFEESFDDIVKYQIIPTLEEYFYDDEKKIDGLKQQVL